MTSILTAAFVTSLGRRSGPRPGLPDEPVPANAKFRRAPRVRTLYDRSDRLSLPPRRPAAWASRLRSSSRWGPPATTAGFLELYSGRTGRGGGQLLHPLPCGDPAEVREARHRRPLHALRRQDSAGDRPGPVDDLSNWRDPSGHGRPGYGSDRMAHSYRRSECSAGLPHATSPSRRATKRASSPSSTAETCPAGRSTGVTAAAGVSSGVRSWPSGRGLRILTTSCSDRDYQNLRPPLRVQGR